MKITKLLSLVIASAFVLSSCSNNENLLPEEETTNSLKSYKVKRDASGAYSLDYDLKDNVKSDKVKNLETNTNEFHLYESDYTVNNRQTEEMVIDGDKLSIGFIDTRTNANSNITIEDDNILLAKGGANKNNMLSEYSISGNEDGSVSLDFKVNSHVSVDFIYNEDLNTYEVHLEKGKSNETDFSRNLTIVEGTVLKIDFVNHIKNDNKAKGFASKETETVRRKPRVVIVSGSDSNTSSSTSS